VSGRKASATALSVSPGGFFPKLLGFVAAILGLVVAAIVALGLYVDDLEIAAIVPIPFAVLGIIAFIVSRVLRATTARRIESPQQDTLSQDPSRFRSAMIPGPLELHMGGSRRTQAIGLSLFAVFWNGVIGVGTWLAIDEAPGIALVFLSLFWIVGLVLLFAAVRACAQLFNPHAVLTLSRADTALGDEVPFQWRITGRSESLTRLCIRLRGTEVATYRRGTDTVTDRNIFHDSVVFQSEQSSFLARGDAMLRIPGDSMHSFDASSNRIVWELAIQGEIPSWPDMEDEIEIRIAPRHDAARALERA